MVFLGIVEACEPPQATSGSVPQTSHRTPSASCELGGIRLHRPSHARDANAFMSLEAVILRAVPRIGIVSHITFLMLRCGV